MSLKKNMLYVNVPQAYKRAVKKIQSDYAEIIDNFNLGEVIINCYCFDKGQKELIVSSSVEFDDIGPGDQHVTFKNNNMKKNVISEKSKIKAFRQFEQNMIFPSIDAYLIDGENYVKMNSGLKKDCLSMINMLHHLARFNIQKNKLKVDFVLTKDDKNLYTQFDLVTYCLRVYLPRPYFDNIAQYFEIESHDNIIVRIIDILEEKLHNIEAHIDWLNSEVIEDEK